MFRRERPQKGRYRQFYQIGAEAIGSDSPLVDAEVIELVITILRQVGLSGYKLLINSVATPETRRAFVALLQKELLSVAGRLCSDCQRRIGTNPLRVLDCKVPEDQPVIDALPSILDHLDDQTLRHFETVQSHLAARGIEYEIRPRLVRGLDYYTRTTFEILHGALGAQNAVCGGGRYDGLAEALGSRVRLPGIGFSIGEDRLVMSVQETNPNAVGHVLDVFLAPLGDAAQREAAAIAAELRAAGHSVELSADTKLKRSLELANKLAARYAVIFGDNELAEGVVQLNSLRR
jgi:histidyl-tRNA synthetase